jgi:hypothetical protein
MLGAPVTLAAVAAAVTALTLVGPALADDGAADVTVARLCYVVQGDAKPAAVRPAPGAQVVHPPVLLDRHAVCVDPPAQARPSIGADELAQRFPGALERRPDLPVAIVQCGGDGATVAAQSSDTLSLSESDFTRHNDLSAVLESCAGTLGASLGRGDPFLGGLVGSGRRPGLAVGPWTPGGSSDCGGGQGPDPRIAEDGGTGGITVQLDEDGIEVDPTDGITVELDVDGIEIETSGGVSVELDEGGIVITPSGSSERPAGDAPESPCQLMEEFIWECEQAGWKRGDCQALDLLLRCGVDVTIVNPTDEGFACPKDATGSETIADAGDGVLLHLCGAEVAHPLPGEDPCGSDGGMVLSGPIGAPGGCDGTIAETDGLGCPTAGPGTTVEGGAPPGPTGPGPEQPASP